MTISIYFGKLEIEDGVKTVEGHSFELDSSTADDYFKSSQIHQRLWDKLTQNFKCFPCLIKLDVETVWLISNLRSNQPQYHQYDSELFELLDIAYAKNPNIYIETR